ncbi:hypothetical protein H8E77_28475 [bacterium]|nr:hypothetical protein [bacterium]
MTGIISDLGVPLVGTLVNLTQNAIEAIKSDALGLLVTNGGRPVYMLTTVGQHAVERRSM